MRPPKQILLFFLFSLAVWNTSVRANAASLDETTRLCYCCKVWGYIKYFHPAVNGCAKNMDSILIAVLPEIESAPDDASFTASLLKMFAFAGPMPPPFGDLPALADSEKINLDLRWHGDAALDPAVRAQLDSVRINYRPLETCYYTPSGTYPPYIVNELDYPLDTAMREPYRLLTLFRIWNIYNYFSPYKFLLDRSWDSALTDVIPLVLAAQDPTDFHLALLQLQSKQQDAHAFAYSDQLNAHFGMKFLPMNFSYVEGKTVVTKVFQRATGVSVGDVVTKIDGTGTQIIRDSLRKYTRGGNEAVIQRNISMSMMHGAGTTATLELDNGTGVRTVTVDRSADSAESADSLIHSSPDGMATKRIQGDIGYINFGVFMASDVSVVHTDLWDTKALIIDCRNYPSSDDPFSALCTIMQDRPSPFAVIFNPNTTFPGTMRFGAANQCGPKSNTDAYNGRIILLVNDMTQSAAEFAVMAMSTTRNAMTVGSHTAGADGNTEYVMYPTGIRMYFTGLGVRYPDGTQTQRAGIKLDHTVTPTIDGIRAGRDEVLEAALSLAGASRVKESIAVHPIELSPNPTSGMFTVHGAGGDYTRVTILDLLGRCVRQQMLPRTSDYSINLSDQNTGCYVARFEGAGGVTTKTVLKK